ncbi:MAG: CoA transferase subunit B [Thermotogae bacterium]|nr:CoA transferase subunit B [Thermotogota bacterium]
MNSKELIARRVAKELKNGSLVNLGIGLPTMVANYIPEDINVMFHSENGIIGMGPTPEEGMENKDLTNAGNGFITYVPGAVSFDSAMSFAIIRGGHLDITVLGGLQVDENGQLANWMVPGKKIPGMGGAMDLVTGAKKVIVAMTHLAGESSKIVKKCTLPLTSLRKVDLIVTDMAVIEPTEEGLLLVERAPGVKVSDILKATEAELIVPDYVPEMIV